MGQMLYYVLYISLRPVGSDIIYYLRPGEVICANCSQLKMVNLFLLKFCITKRNFLSTSNGTTIKFLILIFQLRIGDRAVVQLVQTSQLNLVYFSSKLMVCNETTKLCWSLIQSTLFLPRIKYIWIVSSFHGTEHSISIVETVISTHSLGL